MLSNLSHHSHVPEVDYEGPRGGVNRYEGTGGVSDFKPTNSFIILQDR